MVVERAPHRVVAVDRDREVDRHVPDGHPNVVDVLLERELGRMDADHDQSLLLVLVRPRADVRERSEPVDARVGPELDEHDLPAEPSRRQRLGVDPVRRAIERRQRSLDRQVPLSGVERCEEGLVGSHDRPSAR